jgi:uncharacterized membrane protein
MQKPTDSDASGASGHQEASLEELTRRNVQTVTKLEEAARADTAVHRLASFVTRACGSMPFVATHAVWFASWILFNTLLPRGFDPYPFTFLTFVVSLEAIFLSSFILIAENNQTATDERRARLDLQVNLLAEQENTKMLRVLVAIADKLGVDVAEAPSITALQQATRPEELLNQIDRSSNSKASR